MAVRTLFKNKDCPDDKEGLSLFFYDCFQYCFETNAAKEFLGETVITPKLSDGLNSLAH